MEMITLQGQIERVTYFSPENGYTVARVRVKGERDLVTVVGSIMEPSPGEILTMTGQWMNHPKFGSQFRVDTYKTQVPATEFGIAKYLGSGLIKGIGPVMAKRIVKRFGKETLTIIDESVERLAQIDGIGTKRVKMIGDAWDAQKEIRSVMVFLQSHGVSSGYAAKIFKQYGSDAISVVTENPYRLAEDIFGIGFVTADKIAEKLGMAKDAPQRIEAGVLYVLHRLADEGHVCYPYEKLVDSVMEILGQERNNVLDALAAASLSGKIVIEDINDNILEFVENNKAIFLKKYHFCETRIALRLKQLSRCQGNRRAIDIRKALAWVQDTLSITLAEMQKTAIGKALNEKILVITGGPGTGKTTTLNGLLKIAGKLGIKILLGAPTGRAAKRMSEATGHPAVTLHRMLSYSIKKAGFTKNRDNPLACDLLVIDEASMIDTILMHHLLKAVPDSAILVLVGDVNQLPSVGAGNVLRDIIESGAFPVVALDTIFRQAETSRIIVNAHRINQGLFPDLKPGKGMSDFFFIQREDPEAVVSLILELVQHRIPTKFGFDPVDGIQVLTPMHRGTLGSANLNQALQQALNPGKEGYSRGSREFRPADKVMQIKNNYDKEVFNGDIGRIKRINRIDQTLTVMFEDRSVNYEFTELDELVHAYAISVHKSQGSEYPAIIVPVVTQHYMLLQRNLIYTAVTRGRSLVVLVGTTKALMMAIKNRKESLRHTRLNHRLL